MWRVNYYSVLHLPHCSKLTAFVFCWKTLARFLSFDCKYSCTIASVIFNKSVMFLSLISLYFGAIIKFQPHAALTRKRILIHVFVTQGNPVIGMHRYTTLIQWVLFT